MDAPPDDDLGDVICDEKDDMLQYGLKIANEISERNVAQRQNAQGLC